MFRYADVAHDAALLGYEERLAKGLEREAVLRAIDDADPVDEARLERQPQRRRELPRLGSARRLAALHR